MNKFEVEQQEDARMDTKSLLNRITFNPEVLCGKTTIRGTRIRVDQVLKYLASCVSTG